MNRLAQKHKTRLLFNHHTNRLKRLNQSNLKRWGYMRTVDDQSINPIMPHQVKVGNRYVGE